MVLFGCLRRSVCRRVVDSGAAEIVRCGLVHVIVEPVRVHKLCVRTPVDDGAARRIVTGEIVFGHGDVKSTVNIAEILKSEGVGIVLGVPRYEEVTVVDRFDREYTGVF